MKTVVCTSPWVPAEWIAAHGMRPRRLRPGAPGKPSPEGLGRGVCPYAAATLDAVLAGVDAAAVVFTTACDQMRYAAAVAESWGTAPTFLLNVPSTWQTPVARALYRDELRRLGRFLERRGGESPSDEALAAAIIRYEEVEAQDLLFVRSETQPHAAGLGVPLAVVGGPLLATDYAIFEMVERSGGRIVLDASEGGERTFPHFDRQRLLSDPLGELIDAYLRIPDVFRRPNDAFYDWLGRELAAREVQGIIFRRYLWCDLWHAELARIRQWSPVPVLDLDADRGESAAEGRTLTRVEAFLETLR